MKSKTKFITVNRLLPILLTAVMCLMALFPLGCGSGNTDPSQSTPQQSYGSTPESTPEITPESTPESTTPEVNSYKISYDLDGGFGPLNPESYTENDELTLSMPLRSGYKFAGWTGTGLTAPTMSVTIPKGSTGNREYKAAWTAMTVTDPTDKPSTELDTTHFGLFDIGHFKLEMV